MNRPKSGRLLFAAVIVFSLGATGPIPAAEKPLEAVAVESGAAPAEAGKAAMAAVEEAKREGKQRRASSIAGEPAAGPTALQKHIAFFDKDGDGIITRPETALGMSQLGFGHNLAEATALAIHLALGPKTTGSMKSLDISVKNINRGKHGSDTGVFDARGRFVPLAFERMFSGFDRNRSGSLSQAEIDAMITANSELQPGDKFASSLEFQLLMLIAADTTEAVTGHNFRALSKERLRQFYDGTLFYALAKQPTP